MWKPIALVAVALLCSGCGGSASDPRVADLSAVVDIACAHAFCASDGGMVCVDDSDDPRNCGGCGRVCPACCDGSLQPCRQGQCNP